MKAIVTLSLLACLSQATLADDQATPTPTPAIYVRPGRHGTAWGKEQYELRRDRQSAADSRAQARAKKKADHAATKTAQAQARAADHDRERAQRQVDAGARREAARATPHATSDLMTRMGFGEQEIAKQKTVENPAKLGVTPSSSGATEEKAPSASPAPDSGSH